MPMFDPITPEERAAYKAPTPAIVPAETSPRDAQKPRRHRPRSMCGSPLETKLRRYKDRAERKHIAWELSDAESARLFIGDCVYCGAKADPLNGIDRVDSAMGYTYGNVVSCCSVCNMMKLRMLPAEFIAHIRKILDHYAGLSGSPLPGSPSPQ